MMAQMVLSKRKRAMGWKMSDLHGISLALCMHKIYMEENHKSIAQPKRRLNPVMQEVVKKDIIQWLDDGIIYPILDSQRFSSMQCVPKKDGMIVITNEMNELIPTRTAKGWRICMDYRKLNDATRKDHYLVSFISQILDRLAGQEYYCFMDGYSGYN